MFWALLKCPYSQDFLIFSILFSFFVPLLGSQKRSFCSVCCWKKVGKKKRKSDSLWWWADRKENFSKTHSQRFSVCCKLMLLEPPQGAERKTICEFNINLNIVFRHPHNCSIMFMLLFSLCDNVIYCRTRMHLTGLLLKSNLFALDGKEVAATFCFRDF